MRKAAIRGAARAYYGLMSADERAQIDRAVSRLERDPSPDGVTTFAIPGVPTSRLYDDGVWRLPYAVPDDATVVIRSITHILDLPGQFRQHPSLARRADPPHRCG